MILLLLVDPQVDFIHPDGALSVPGAMEDTARTVEWITRNNDKITQIITSLDTHTPQQIFFPSWWQNTAGKHPEPFTPITADDLAQGRWQPVFQPEWSAEYVTRLEREGKKTLMIWPYHTLAGTAGHAVTPTLLEAINHHAAAHNTEPTFLRKGSVPKTEHYSIFESEIKVPVEAASLLSTELLDHISTFDAVYVAGQAKSHCVLETLSSMIKYFGEPSPEIKKIHLLTDCTSSVVHPSIDFDALANAQLAEWSKLGLQLVKSTPTV